MRSSSEALNNYFVKMIRSRRYFVKIRSMCFFLKDAYCMNSYRYPTFSAVASCYSWSSYLDDTHGNREVLYSCLETTRQLTQQNQKYINRELSHSSNINTGKWQSLREPLKKRQVRDTDRINQYLSDTIAKDSCYYYKALR